MKKVLFGVVVTLVGVLACEKAHTRAYREGYNKGVKDCTDGMELIYTVIKAVEKDKKES